MVKVVLNTTQVPGLLGLPPGSRIWLGLSCVVESSVSPESAGYEQVVLDVKGARVLMDPGQEVAKG
jgi:hypothetical protein